jgi:hypothetical protein
MAKKNVESLRQYWQEIATKAGIDPAQAAAMDAALGDESVARAFRQAFVPVPEHHSTLDELKNESAAKIAEYDKWYKETAMPAYNTNLAGIERLHQYESVYGDLEPGSVSRSDARDLGFNSKAELDKYLDERLRAQQSGFVGLAKTIPRISSDYLHRFGDVLDIDEVERIAVKEGLPPDLAYERYIAPKVEAQRQADFEAKLKEAREQGAKDAVSRYHLPVDTTPKESSPFFDRTSSTEKAPANEFEEDRTSRASFLDGWNNYAEGIANKVRSS